MSTLCLWGCMSTLCLWGHFDSSGEYIMLMRTFQGDVMFMRTSWLIVWVHYVYKDVLGGRYVHEDNMAHRMSTLGLWGRYAHENMTHQVSTLRYVHEDIMTHCMSTLCLWGRFRRTLCSWGHYADVTFVG